MDCEQCSAYRIEIALLEGMVVDPKTHRHARVKLMLKKIMGFLEKAHDHRVVDGDWPVIKRLFDYLVDEIPKGEEE